MEETKERKVISRAVFTGIIPKNKFYIILLHINALKQDGFIFEVYNRTDTENQVIYNYILNLYE